MKTFYSLILLILSLTGSTAFSQSGFLDASFGTGGKVVTATGDSSSVANSVAITAEGKIVVGGYSFFAGNSVATLLQYNSDGTIDTTFGNGGKAILSSINSAAINSIALQPDGKIVVGGVINLYAGDFLIARYNKNGILDSTFGINGIAPLIKPDSIGYGGAIVNKVIIRSNGKILSGGKLFQQDFENYALYAQYLPNGNIDSSFGTNGSRIASTNFVYLATADNVNDLALTTDGKTLAIINETPYNPTGTSFLINRFLSNGDYDSTFGTNGSVTTYISPTSGGIAYSTVVLPDNSFVVTGYSYAGPPTYITSIALVKYHPDGSIDSTFGTNGKVLTGSNTSGNHILLSPDGNLIVSGYTSTSNGTDFVIVKYHPNGILDSSFGTNGITTTDFSGNSDVSYSSALQPDGKVVLAGSTGSSTNYNIALARYNNTIVYPLHLLSFTAIKMGTANLLQWQTAQEINTDGFAIQRSANGNGYNAIGYVKAGNNSYQFTDAKPLAGNNYYRFRMIDKNGSFTYSPVREITNNNTFTVSVYPNPVKDKLQVHISSDKSVAVQMRIVANDGKVISSNQWTAQAGNSTKEVPVISLQKGIYYLVVTTKANERAVVLFEKL